MEYSYLLQSIDSAHIQIVAHWADKSLSNHHEVFSIGEIILRGFLPNFAAVAWWQLCLAALTWERLPSETMTTFINKL